MFIKLIISLSLTLFSMTTVSAKNYKQILDNHLEQTSQKTTTILENIEAINLSNNEKINKLLSLILLLEVNDDVDHNPIGENLNLTQNELNQIVQVIQGLKISKRELDKTLGITNSLTNISLDSKKWLNRIHSVKKDMARYVELKMGTGLCVFTHGKTYEEAISKLGLTPGNYYSSLESDEESDRFVIAQCYCKGFQCSGQIQDL